jgi:hypothetical protein
MFITPLQRKKIGSVSENGFAAYMKEKNAGSGTNVYAASPR